MQTTKWTPEAEEAFREGMKVGLENITYDAEMSKGWTAVGLMAAGLSGFLVGAMTALVVAFIIFR